MPTYEYECRQCQRLFEVFQSIKEDPKTVIATDCRECAGQAPVTRRIGMGGGLIFKGSGFYVTDYRSDGYKKAAQADGKSGDSKGGDSAKGGASKSGESKSSSGDSKPSGGSSSATPAAS